MQDTGRVTYQPSTSFKKTEELLYLFPKLPPEHPQRRRVEEALATIRDDEYAGIITSRYFEHMTIAEIAEVYDVKYQNISKKRNRLIRTLASELFPEDVLRELLER